MSEFDQIFAALDQMRDRVIQGAAAGLDQGAAAMQDDAQATDAYAGVTGATRAGTVAYVAGAGVDSSSVLAAAAAAVQDHNPEHVLLQQVDSVGDDELAVVLTVPSDYIDIIEGNVGGAEAFLGPTLEAHAERLTAAVAQGIAGVLR